MKRISITFEPQDFSAARRALSFFATELAGRAEVRSIGVEGEDARSDETTVSKDDGAGVLREATGRLAAMIDGSASWLVTMED